MTLARSRKHIIQTKFKRPLGIQLKALPQQLLCDLKQPDISIKKTAQKQLATMLESTFTLELVSKIEQMAKDKKTEITLPSTLLVKTILGKKLTESMNQMKDKFKLPESDLLKVVYAELKKMPEKKSNDNDSEQQQKSNDAFKYQYSLLYKTKDQQWRIRKFSRPAGRVDEVADGHYAFVQTELGFIRVLKCAPDETNHRLISRHAEKVRFAGVVEFAGGKITRWNNTSGSYQPQEGLERLVGFPMQTFQLWSKSLPLASTPPSSPIPINELNVVKISRLADNKGNGVTILVDQAASTPTGHAASPTFFVKKCDAALNSQTVVAAPAASLASTSLVHTIL